VARPLIIPRYDSVGKDIILALIRTAGITREAFLRSGRTAEGRGEERPWHFSRKSERSQELTFEDCSERME